MTATGTPSHPGYPATALAPFSAPSGGRKAAWGGAWCEIKVRGLLGDDLTDDRHPEPAAEVDQGLEAIVV